MRVIHEDIPRVEHCFIRRVDSLSQMRHAKGRTRWHATRLTKPLRKTAPINYTYVSNDHRLTTLEAKQSAVALY